jgi:hypothetical protein
MPDPPTNLTVQEQFLLREYEAASKLTFHVDDLRDRLVKFFLSFSGLAAAALMMLLKGEAEGGEFGYPEGVVGLFFFVVATLGIIVVRVLGRLRAVQIEHFRITNNIREYFLGQDLDLWNVVELSKDTLPRPGRKSGTYAWVLSIIVITSYFAGFGLYLFVFKVGEPLCEAKQAYALAAAFGLALIFALDFSYFKAACAPEPRSYENPPVKTVADG